MLKFCESMSHLRDCLITNLFFSRPDQLHGNQENHRFRKKFCFPSRIKRSLPIKIPFHSKETYFNISFQISNLAGLMEIFEFWRIFHFAVWKSSRHLPYTCQITDSECLGYNAIRNSRYLSILILCHRCCYVSSKKLCCLIFCWFYRWKISYDSEK